MAYSLTVTKKLSQELLDEDYKKIGDFDRKTGILVNKKEEKEGNGFYIIKTRVSETTIFAIIPVWYRRYNIYTLSHEEESYQVQGSYTYLIDRFKPNPKLLLDSLQKYSKKFSFLRFSYWAALITSISLGFIADGEDSRLLATISACILTYAIITPIIYQLKLFKTFVETSIEKNHKKSPVIKSNLDNKVSFFRKIKIGIPFLFFLVIAGISLGMAFEPGTSLDNNSSNSKEDKIVIDLSDIEIEPPVFRDFPKDYDSKINASNLTDLCIKENNNKTFKVSGYISKYTSRYPIYDFSYGNDAFDFYDKVNSPNKNIVLWISSNKNSTKNVSKSSTIYSNLGQIIDKNKSVVITGVLEYNGVSNTKSRCYFYTQQIYQ